MSGGRKQLLGQSSIVGVDHNVRSSSCAGAGWTDWPFLNYPQHYASPHAESTVNLLKVESADDVNLALRFGSQNCQLMEAAIYFGWIPWKRRSRFKGLASCDHFILPVNLLEAC
jgi:hypothetical protein